MYQSARKGAGLSPPFSLFTSRESVQTVAMDGQLLLLWRNPSVQAAILVIISWQLVAGAVTPIERLRECRRAKSERRNSGSYDEF